MKESILSEQSPFVRKLVNNPIWQAVVVVVLVFIFSSLRWILGQPKEGLFDTRYPWIVGGSFLLFFCMVNCIFYLLTDSRTKFRLHSFYIFIVLTACIIGIATLFSGISIMEAGTFSWIFIVIGGCYLVFLTISGLVMFITLFAEKEEWFFPRIRNKKKKK